MIPELEFEDGYPTERSLKDWDSKNSFDVSLIEAKSFLLDILPTLEEQMPCWSITTKSIKDPHFTDEVLEIVVTTGGWSGAEDLIEAMLSKFWIKYYQYQWRRGGVFWFRVPKKG